MARRSAAVSGARKPRRSRVAKTAAKKQRRKPASVAELRAQMTATSRVLELIAKSPSDLQPVFDAIVQTAVRLVGCETAFIQRCDGRHFWSVARCRREDGLVTVFNPRHAPIDPNANFPSRAIVSRTTLHLPDWSQIELPEFERRIQEQLGYQSAVYLPLLREQECIGVLGLAGSRPGMFGETEIALAEFFRDQALIAIENTRLFNEVQAKTHDLEESLQQQTATSEVLQVISRSVFDLKAVLRTLLESAAGLCDASICILFQSRDNLLHVGASYGGTPEFVEYLSSHPHRFDRTTVAGRAAVERRTVHIPDIAADTEYGLPQSVKLGGWQSIIGVPLLRDGEVLGVLDLARPVAGPFTPRQIKLIETFADQAVIAIENARLFDEVQNKTRDLEESLQQQTATSEILAVISRSPSDLNPVLETISDTAAKLCGSEQTMFFRYDGTVFRILASWNFPPDVHEMLERRPLKPGHPSAIGRAGASLRPVCIPDVLADPNYGLTGEQSPARYRATLAVPLLREGRLIGALSLNRSQPGAFTEKQIELVTTFADQAVIAIENARLFDEVQAKTRDLTEALAYQTGSGNVLRVIASSPTDINPVLEAIVESARELCESDDAVALLKDGENLRFSAHSGPIASRVGKWPISRNWTAGRAFVDQKPVHVHDMLSDEGAVFPDARAMGQDTGATIRTVLSVPLLRGNESIGAILLRRTEVSPFKDKQIDLLSTFADQAVIAIQNAKLFNETKEALERQTATADILKVIASSPEDVQPVFEAIASSARRLIGGFSTAVHLVIDDMVHLVAYTPTTPEADEILVAAHPRHRSEVRAVALVENGEIAQIADSETADPHTRQLGRARGWRSVTLTPLMNQGTFIGFIASTRREPGVLTGHQLELLRTFADQAGIAIENVRLFDELQARTRELSKSLDNLRTAQDRLVQTEKLASLGQLTAGIAHEIKNPLNFVNNFSALSAELIDELDETLAPAPLDQTMRDEVRELTGMLKSNLEKVVQHGRRADSIVKNMLLHSREGSGERRSQDLNTLVSESLNLAYHGARAERSDFNITLEQDLDPDAGAVDVYPQDITRALLNLISNGFYAAIRRKKEADGAAFEPVLSAATRNAGNTVEIRIRDNGTGIPVEIREKIFNPFFTTKPTGEGTGLGLSMTHDIIVKQHGGRIDLATETGAFTEFTITLPRANEGIVTPKSR